MQRREFEEWQRLTELAYSKCEAFLNSDALDEVKKGMQELTAKYPRLSVCLDCHLEVCDPEKEDVLPLLRFGVTANEGRSPYIHHADCTTQRYLVNGAIHIVPHDHCPNCWGIWDFKYKNKVCPHCSFSVGKEVRYMLDTDTCPYCERGKMTSKNLTCDDCGFQLLPSEVAWG